MIKKNLLSLGILLLSLVTPAHAGPAFLNGSSVVTLKSSVSLNGVASIIAGTINPSVVTTAGERGSLYLSTSTAQLYQKTDTGTTANWTAVQSAAGSHTAGLVARAVWAATANCDWSNTTSSYTNVPADTDCPNPTITTSAAWAGTVTAPGTKIPGLVFSTLPAGVYHFQAIGLIQVIGGNQTIRKLRFSDGTVNSTGSLYNGSANIAIGGFFGTMYYSSAQASSTTIQIQSWIASTDTFGIDARTDDFEIDVYYEPGAS